MVDHMRFYLCIDEYNDAVGVSVYFFLQSFVRCNHGTEAHFSFSFFLSFRRYHTLDTASFFCKKRKIKAFSVYLYIRCEALLARADFYWFCCRKMSVSQPLDNHNEFFPSASPNPFTASADGDPAFTVPPPVSRWSEARFHNLDIPTYVPPESFSYLGGHFMRALRLRAIIHDFQRILATDSSDQCYVNIPLIPSYNESGERTNTPHNLISEKRLKAITELSGMLSLFDDRSNADIKAGKEVFRKIRFTKEQVMLGAWGALLGARGAIHQQLEKQYNCRIILAGRGITDPTKDPSANAAIWALEEPHVRLSAATEDDLQAAAERIEWILSDAPEAAAFRELNRKKTAKVEGFYDPRTWVDKSKAAAANGNSSGGTADGSSPAEQHGEGRKREREEAPSPQDEELDEFLNDFDD